MTGMRLSRTAASYKMVQGLGHTFSERTFESIRSTPFSINLDESTSNSNKKVLSILVCYFNQELKHVVVEHLGSIEVLKGTAQYLETALVTFFNDHKIPFANLISMMMDSCNVMRGRSEGRTARTSWMLMEILATISTMSPNSLLPPYATLSSSSLTFTQTTTGLQTR